MVAWRRDVWNVSRQVARRFSLSITLRSTELAGDPWSVVTVYGLVDHHLKDEFLAELRVAKDDCEGEAILCGDFNMIYRLPDKSNDRLNLRAMRRFRRALDEMTVDELHLHGRLYTWSNERRRPTFERIDRVFATVPWLELFPTSTCGRYRLTLLITYHCSFSSTPCPGPSQGFGSRRSGRNRMVSRMSSKRLGISALMVSTLVVSWT